MIIETTRKVEITLHDSDIDLMKNILMLACQMLNQSPVSKLSRPAPIYSQCGFVGGELIATREMLERLNRGLNNQFYLIDIDSMTKLNTASTLDRSVSLVKVNQS